MEWKSNRTEGPCVVFASQIAVRTIGRRSARYILGDWSDQVTVFVSRWVFAETIGRSTTWDRLADGAERILVEFGLRRTILLEH